MDKAITVLLGVAGVVFALVGAAWFTVPTIAAANFDMSLLAERALGTQIADLGSFFLTVGICMLLGRLTSNPVWNYPPMMLMGIASCGRVIAWLAHGAALTLDMIAVEVVFVLLLGVDARRMKGHRPPAETNEV